MRNVFVNRVSAKQVRPGSVLILVLVTLAMLGFGAYAFSEAMLSEYRALRSGTAEIRTRAAADSGVLSALTMVDRARGRSSHDRLLANVEPILWNDSRGDEYAAFLYASPAGTSWAKQKGLLDESVKLNLNSLLLDDEHILESRQRLMMLPGMTITAADSLLDWIDPDDFPREFGAESNWYLSNGRSYVPRQGSIDSLQELLLVRGISSALLFGEDTNGNGWLDVNEDDGDATLPLDNQDRVLSPGLSQWVTVISAESNYNARGNLKVFINDDDLVRLYRQVDEVLGKDAARFIVALRMNGPMDDENAERFDSAAEIAKRRASAEVRARRQTSESSEIAMFRPKTIDGFAINRSATFEIRSTVDLLAQRTEAFVDGQESLLKSPWNDDLQSVTANLATLDGCLSLSTGEQSPSRINFMLASREVLMTIPKMTIELASRIVQRREQLRGAPVSLGWLYQSGTLNLRQFRLISPYLCSHGDVYSGVSIGTIAGTPQATVAQFEVDAIRPHSRLMAIAYHRSPAPLALDSRSDP